MNGIIMDSFCDLRLAGKQNTHTWREERGSANNYFKQSLLLTCLVFLQLGCVRCLSGFGQSLVPVLNLMT